MMEDAMGEICGARRRVWVVKGNWDWQARKQTVWTNGRLPNKEAAMLYNSSARHKDRMHSFTLRPSSFLTAIRLALFLTTVSDEYAQSI